MDEEDTPDRAPEGASEGSPEPESERVLETESEPMLETANGTKPDQEPEKTPETATSSGPGAEPEWAAELVNAARSRRWQSLATSLLTFGFGIFLLALSTSSSGRIQVYSQVIAGAICYLLAVVLALVLHFNVAGQRIIALVSSLMAFFATILITVGYGLSFLYGPPAGYYYHPQPYSCVLYVLGAFLALIGGIFLLISSFRRHGRKTAGKDYAEVATSA